MKKGTCKYFTGLMNKTCSAGVCYRDVTPQPDEAGQGLRLPCITEPFSQSEKHLAQFARRGTCQKYAEPSAEEIAKFEKDLSDYIEKMQVVCKALDPIRKAQKGKDWSGVIECPVCKGRLHLSHAAYNGHMRVCCETDGCVNWIE